MIPKVADPRRDGKSSFVKLVTYVTIRDDVKMSETLSPDRPFTRQSRSNESNFRNLITYIDRQAEREDEVLLAEFPDGRSQVKSGDVVCETNCFSLQTAAAEMNAVAMQSRRCEDPVYHFILSWPTVDNPSDEAALSSARECIRQLGMDNHQYVSAIHRDTNHVHCHVAVNRVNPVSYRAAKLWNDFDTLHKTCRRLELKHNWLPTNGSWVSQDGVIVRPHREYKNGPDKARQLEYYADQESLFSYAVEHCRSNINELLHERKFNWEMIHDVFISAGLELRQKGDGLAIYDNSDSPVSVPVKASHLHPALTLSALEPRIGRFTQSPETDRSDSLVVGYAAESWYNPKLHARDKGARAERREERAQARDDLKARYQNYKNSWVKPRIPAEEIKSRYSELSEEYRLRRQKIRMISDPLLRKMLMHAVVIDRMIAHAALRTQLKAEMEALKNQPGGRMMSYPQWVEVQALNHDKAAISQLRGWAYRAKRDGLTPSISGSVLRCAVADNIPAYDIEGYQTQITRDGVISYWRDGKVGVQDRGNRIEVAGEKPENIVTAFCLAERKSGEMLEVRGDKDFVHKALSMVPEFNRSGEKPLPLTHPVQRQLAGYETRQPPLSTTAGKHILTPGKGHTPGQR